MPWEINGTFIRVNPDYSGATVWQQDQQASIKIIASRHDYHDEDLALGIQNSLNLQGYNQMLANLNMGGFKITTMADGTLTDDAAAWGQIAGAIDYAGSILTLLDNDGNVIDTTTIAGGGGGGGVVAIGDDATETLEFSPNPIIDIGTIGLKFVAAGQTYTGGIDQVTVDDFGRVTQVITGGTGSSTDLSNTPSSDTVIVESSTGDPTTIVAAIPSSIAGVMTALQAQQLADLVSGAAAMAVPIQIVGVDEEVFLNYLDSVKDWMFEDGASIGDAGVWETAYSRTGSGIIEFLGFEQGGLSAGADIDIRLVLDDVVVWEANNMFSDGSTSNGDGMALIGFTDGTQTEPTLSRVDYSSSFKIEMKSTQNNNSSLSSFMKQQIVS